MLICVDPFVEANAANKAAPTKKESGQGSNTPHLSVDEIVYMGFRATEFASDFPRSEYVVPLSRAKSIRWLDPPRTRFPQFDPRAFVGVHVDASDRIINAAPLQGKGK